jgi:hypothetical protein
VKTQVIMRPKSLWVHFCIIHFTVANRGRQNGQGGQNGQGRKNGQGGLGDGDNYYRNRTTTTTTTRSG